MRVTVPRVSSATTHADILGESPVWSTAEQALYWVDIRRPAIHRLDGATHAVTTIECPLVVGCIGLRAGGGLVVAMHDGFHMLDTASGTFTMVAAPANHLPPHRFNDGRCDARGAFWASTMNDVAREPTGGLYRLASDGTTTQHGAGWIVPNGIAFSPSGRTMYFADTFADTLLTMDLDAEAGLPGQPRRLASTAALGGHPDGATVDADGCLWSALHGAGRLARVTPSGVIDRVVELPVTQVTSCAFGGARLDILYVTTACQRLDAAERRAQPWAGRVLMVETGCTGLPEPAFRGQGMLPG